MNIFLLCSLFIFLSAQAMEESTDILGKAIYQTFLSSGTEETFVWADLGDDTETTIKKAVEKNCVRSNNYAFKLFALNALVPTNKQLNDENDLKNDIWINDDIKNKLRSTFCDVVRDEYNNSKIYVSLNNKYAQVDIFPFGFSFFPNKLSYSLYDNETKKWNYVKPMLCYNHLYMGCKAKGCKIRILCFDQKTIDSMKDKIFYSVILNELLAMHKGKLDNPTLYIIDNKLQDPVNPQAITTNKELHDFLKTLSIS